MPDTVGGMEYLTDMQMHNNKLSGTLPAELFDGAWRGLGQNLLLSGSSSDEGNLDWGSPISGTLPTEVGLLTALPDFELNNLRRSAGDLELAIERGRGVCDNV